MNFIDVNIYLYVRGKIILLCRINIILLLKELPQKMIPYLIME
jgi:hypothetical protein